MNRECQTLAQVVVSYLTFIGTLFLCPFVFPQDSDTVLHPRSIDSKSGKYSVHIDPSDRYGRGSANYTLRMEQQVLWTKEFPYTLRKCVVTDRGFIVGYGYTQGERAMGGDSQPDAGDFVIATLDFQGNEVLIDINARVESSLFKSMPVPLGQSLLVDEAKDRFAIHVINPIPGRQEEQWWGFEISTGMSINIGVEEFDAALLETATRPEPHFKYSEEDLVLPSWTGTYDTISLKTEFLTSLNPIRSIHSGFDFNDEGYIGTIRNNDASSSSFLLLDSISGKLLFETSLDVDGRTDESWEWTGIAYVGDHTFIFARSESSTSDAQVYQLRTDTKSFQRIEAFRSSFIESIASDRNGSFVVLTNNKGIERAPKLTMYSVSGNRQWTVASSFADYPKTLFSPASVAMNETNIAVLDNIKKQVQIFDRVGKLSQCIDLAEAWGRQPNFPSQITLSRQGEILVYDFQGKPSFQWMEPSGRFIQAFDVLNRIDNRPVACRSAPQFDADGQVWLSDGDVILRVDHWGLVNRTLGERDNLETIGEAAAVKVDRDGSFAIQSKRTKVIHRFDPDGAVSQILNDLELKDSKFCSDPLSITNQGEVFVTTLDEYESSVAIEFNKEGQRINLLHFGFSKPRARFQTPDFIGQNFADVIIADRDGSLVRKIERQHDRNWLQNVDQIQLAPDGSFAVTATHRDSVPALPCTVNVYQSNGDSVSTFAPPGLQRYTRFDFDGKTIVLCGEKAIEFYDIEGRLKTAIAYPEQKSIGHWRPTLVRNGSELMLVDIHTWLRIRRIKLPHD
jgi:hypothetical protein